MNNSNLTIFRFDLIQSVSVDKIHDAIINYMGENPNLEKFNELQKHIELIQDAMLNFMKENLNSGKLKELKKLIELITRLEYNLYEAIHISMLEFCFGFDLSEKLKGD